MTTFAISKVLAALPGTLDADMVYAVRVGAGFDLYITDDTGAIAYKVNSDNSIPIRSYTANHTATSTDVLAISEMDSASAIAFTIDPTTMSAGDRGMVRQVGTGQASIVVSSGTIVKGGPTAKTYQKGSLLSWELRSTSPALVYVNGECAAS